MSENKEINTVHQIALTLEGQIDNIEGLDVRRGKLGIALFYLLYADFTKDQKFYMLAINILESVISQLNENYNSHNLSFEFAEIGRFTEYIKYQYDVDFGSDDLGLFFDAYQKTDLENNLKKGDCDPYTGSLINGYYFLSRLKSHPEVISELEKLVYGIERASETDDDGNMFWISQLHGKREIYLGLSHGNASIILFLGKLYKQNILPEKCLEIIQKAASYIISHKYEVHDSKNRDFTGSLYPTLVGDRVTTPLCWCYGDLGIGLAFSLLNKIQTSQFYSDRAKEIFENALNRISYEETRIGDAGLCYGASGTSLIFNQYYIDTNDTKYLTASEYWHNKIFEFSIHENDTCGYKAQFNQSFISTNISFNDGIAGIGCAILSRLNNDYLALNEFLNID